MIYALRSTLRVMALAVAVVTPSLALAEPFRLILTHIEPPLVPNSVMDLAEELGYFEREGVDVELIRVQQTPSALAALQAGAGEMANVSVDALLHLVAQGGNDFKAVASPNKSLPFLIAAKAEYPTPVDLNGRSFGVGRVGSLDHSLSMNVLAQHDVDVSSLEILTLGQPSVRAQALAAGQVDATTMSIGVWLSLPDREGLTVVIDQEQYYEAAPVVNKVNVVPESVLDERRDDVIAVVRALVRISRDFAENPSAWAEAMDPLVPGIGREQLDTLARSFEGSWSVNGGMSRDELAYTQDWIYQTPDFADVAPVDLAAWTDFTVIDAVLAGMGTDETADRPTR
ncbi:ABC transporter substrate-binding protein [Devosia limi DSM 17137]|uniref:ABC transporter substrate-binding protein n=2 Tax=Devosia TaxID=46913 RepID=A0A0F5L378_9HYPH|nr:ABC transporter substrate-binding protein [Devosia limi DSM 17137]SHF28445.1 NitT/TauT family transport system substrate-binding protein [Devosia limi DSM 17137]